MSLLFIHFSIATTMFVLVLMIICTYSSLVKSTYVIFAPKEFRSGVKQNIGVHILKAQGNVTVKAELSGRARNVIVSQIRTFTPDSNNLMELMIPSNLGQDRYPLRVKGTGGLTFETQTTITNRQDGVIVHIQTDKGIYKAGQPVRFRTFATYPNLRLYYGKMDIEIYDPKGNKIQQWLNVEDRSGVFNSSMVMDKHPVLGSWQITVKAHGKTKTKTFKVKEYVLPKFKVTLHVPNYILATANTVHGSVKAKYTFGKPVHGNVRITAKLEKWPSYRGKEPIEIQSLRMVSDGEVKFSVQLSNIKQKYGNWNLEGQNLVVVANVTESMTRLSMLDSKALNFKSLPYKMEILPSTKTTFKPGLPFIVDVKVVRHDGSKISGNNIRVSVKGSTAVERYFGNPYNTYNNILPTQHKVVPASGDVSFKIALPKNAIKMELEIVHKSITIRKTIKKYYTSGGKYVDLRVLTKNPVACKKLKIQARSNIYLSVLNYQVWARGNLVKCGQLNCKRQKNCNIYFDTSVQMAPKAEIIAYYVDVRGEIIADAVDVPISGIFENEVSLRFDKKETVPGKNVTLSMTSDPYSFVYILAVDKSLSLLQMGNDLSDEQVAKEIEAENPLQGGIGIDTKSLFKSSCTNVMTDAVVYKYVKPPKPTTPRPRPFPGPPPRVNVVSVSNLLRPVSNIFGFRLHSTNERLNNKNNESGRKTQNVFRVRGMKPVKLRTEFPETWIWESRWSGADGNVTITEKIPDTITSWSASSFAVNKKTGLGIPQSTAQITGFRNFFVSLNLPYSVIRGEEVVIQVNIFNYLRMDLMLMVVLTESQDFQNIYQTFDGQKKYASQPATESAYVDLGGRPRVRQGRTTTLGFPIRPQTLGLINIEVRVMSMFSSDGVRRTLLVEPEGIPKVYNKPLLLGVNFGKIVRKKVKIGFPPSLVVGSDRVKVSVIGDFMGPTVNNLDNLLRMPYGCGEQTMLNLAPNVFVANYLKDTNQITAALRVKLNNYIEKGYQRELKYQRRDGSFSAFGNSDRSGSMWLTAFVVKTFHKSKSHIFVDVNVIIKAIRWIISKQAADGSFPEPGRVIHREMQGGTSKGQQLTAFVLIALAENINLNNKHTALPVINAIYKARRYLDRKVYSLHDNHGIAIVTYALYVSSSRSAPSIFRALNRRAINKGDYKYWHQKSVQTLGGTWKPLYRQATPIDIESTAYGLILHAKYKLLGDGLRILKWLTTQRNSNGGFSSTQDTVVALESFAVFAASTKTHKPDMNVIVRADQFKESFHIKPANSLVLQSTELPKPLPRTVHIEANGHGMAIADVSIFYNVKKDYEKNSFDVTVKIIEETIDLLRLRACTRFLKGGKSGMTIQEVGIPTGFEVDEEDIKGNANLKKIENQDKKVVLYFNEISNHPTCINLKAIRTALVSKIKPSSVRVYDYYDPEKQGTTFYASSVLKNSSVCDVCKFCRVCRKYTWWLWK